MDYITVEIVIIALALAAAVFKAIWLVAEDIVEDVISF